MELTLTHGDKKHVLTLDVRDKEFHFKIENRDYRVSRVEHRGDRLSFIVNDRVREVYCVRTKDALHVNIDGTSYVFLRKHRAASGHRQAGATKGDSVMSPMPGMIVKILVGPGDEVTAGTILAIVEAMKMQNELRAPRMGVVKKINFKEGDQVDALQPIVELEKA